MKNRRIDGACLLLLGVAAAMFMSRAVWSGNPIGVYPSDGTRLHYFVREYLLQSVAAGRLPLWNPFTQFGAPFLANMQWGVFYPLNFALARVPTDLAYNLFIGIHLWLAGAFMYLLARDWRLEPAPACVAGASFMFSGRLISMAWGGGLNHLSAAAWLPLIVLCFSRTEKARSVRAAMLWAVACSGAWTLQILSGHPQYSYLSALVTLALAAWTAGERPRGPGRLIPFWIWLATIAAGLALSAVQLGPTYEAMALSTRSFGWHVVSVPSSFEGSYNPIRLVTWLMPDVFGNAVSLRPAATDWLSLVLKEPHSDEFRGYMGVLPLVLALMTAADWRRDRRVLVLWSLVLGSLLLAIGDLTPFYGLLYRVVPPFRVFRIPARFLNVVSFGMALLAGVGAQRLLDAREHDQRIRQWTKSLIVLVALIVIGTVVGVAARTQLLAYGQQLARPLFALRPSGFSLPTADRSALVAHAYALGLGSALTAAMFLAATAATIGLAAGRNRRVAVACVVVVTGLDLGLQAHMYSSAEPMAIHYPGNAALVALLRSAPDQSRAYTFAPSGPSTRPDPIRPSDNVFMHEHLLTAAGYDSFELQTYRAARDLLDADLKSGSSFVASLFGLKYIVSTTPLSSAGLRRLDEIATAGVYENAAALPRFYVAGRARRVSDPAAALAQVQNRDVRPGDEVLVESAGPLPDTPPGSAGDARVLDAAPEQIELSVHATRDGYLVANDTFYPGWAAAVDGRAAPILRANGLVRAVPVAAGDHRVTMTFAPAPLSAGWRISATTAGVLALVVCGLLAMGARRGQTAAATQPLRETIPER
jgi:hypothetical protein